MPLRVVNQYAGIEPTMSAVREATMSSNISAVQKLPDWLPDAVRLYLDHTEDGLSYRELARREGRHASTVMRTVRRYETRRDDPLLDEALTALAQGAPSLPKINQEDDTMTAAIRPSNIAADQETINTEGKRILRRLVEAGAVLAFAPDMDKAMVMREFPDGRTLRTAVVDRTLAQAFALKDWIVCRKPGRVSTYEITATGKTALRAMLAKEAGGQGFAEAATDFGAQHREWGERTVDTETVARRIRYNLAESPVSVLGRRRDKDGKVFLEPELVSAAEKLREDFELAQMGPRVAQNWERFLTGSDRGSFRGDSGMAEGPSAARDRVAAALRDLGPGLGDVALRVCCFLEGVETAEQRLGWAARSGKVVLKIALQRLQRHFELTYGRSGPLIG
jgi:transposase-like protein